VRLVFEGIFLRDNRRDLEGAEAAFRRAEQLGHPKASLNLIDLYAERGDLEAAERAEERALELALRHRTVFEEMQGPKFTDLGAGRALRLGLPPEAVARFLPSWSSWRPPSLE